jgi:hypothetical protein
MDEWRVVDGALSVWYDAPSQAAGAALVVPGAEVDVRARGVRVRIPSSREDLVVVAQQVSEAAAGLGLRADPSALQVVRLQVEAGAPGVLRDFWGTVLGYRRTGPDGLEDPLSQTPGIVVREAAPGRGLRNRLHLDVGRPEQAVGQAKAELGQEAFGAYGLTLADPEANEVDLVPGEPLPGAEDWLAQFAAMTFYPTSAEGGGLAAVVAELADAAGIELYIDVRADGVVVDSLKDRWENDDDQADQRFVALAREVQDAARGMGLTAEPERLRFVQVAFDAVDIPAVQGFWRQVLGYEHDRREFLADIFDPRGFGPVLMFQQLDPDDERLHERSRMFLELAVPADQVESRVGIAEAAGGKVLQRAENRCLVGDPEGNELLITWVG